MKDFFGNKRPVLTTGQIASSEFAVIKVGNNSREALVQSLNVSYNRQVETITEVGSTAIHWVPGRSSGTFTISKLVGNEFFENWETECGIIESLSVNVTGGNCGFTGGGAVSFTGGVLVNVGFSLSAQSLQITQNATVNFASMSKR